ncbi:hypothetical protein [Nocardia stercoris]|uniref:DUF4194 domain-containing protein n=1 Tax=Nocardia stercoris TaxID=2483361 RepID=A0A3M2LDA9_9NOCA|nr:hypothetical protein [Nocardia stercoris]RMI32678.1 hypothetical protein EBN03_11975 [Nocardia stercoris]
MKSSSAHEDIGRFLAWAARPKETPARNEELHRLVRRYYEEPDFASAVDEVFAGAGLDLDVDDRDGIIATARNHSPLRLTVTDVSKRAPQHHRAVLGAVILAVARTAYPDSSMLDDPDRIAVFTTQSVVDTLDRVAESLAENSTDDSDIDDDLVEAWRRWIDLSPARPNARRRSTGDRAGLVAKVCKILAEAGFLAAKGDTDGGVWAARPRFRYAVGTLCDDSDLFRLVNGLADRSADAHEATLA